MDYQDFFLHIDRDEDGLFVRVDSDTYGQTAAKNRLDFDHEALPGRLKAIEKCLLCMLHPSTADRHIWRRKLETDLKQLGGDLGHILTSDNVGMVFERILGQLDGDRQKGLRIRIASDPTDGHLHPIVAAAWELIHDASVGGIGFFGQHRQFPISRYFTGLGAIPQLPLDGPLRVLLVTSQPEDMHPVQASAEIAAIRGTLEAVEGVEVLEAPPVLTKVRDSILDKEVHVLHFIGHGGFNDELGEGWATFADENNAPARWPGDLMADRLKGLTSLMLVVLSNCYGATQPRDSQQDAFRTVAPALLRANIPAVVAMQFPISDAAALAFSRRFYERLVAFDPVDVATTEARLAITDLSETKETRIQWPLPAVFMRVDDGRLLRPAKASPTANAKPSGSRSDGGAINPESTNPESTKLRVGIRNFAKGFGEGMENRVDRFLSLDDLFDGRSIREPTKWNNELMARLHKFSATFYTERRALEFDFAALWSVVFATGWYLEAKSGLDISMIQRSQDGQERYYSQQGECPEGRLWQLEDHEISTGADLAVAISLSRSTIADVREFLGKKDGPPVGRLLHASVAEPGPKAVKSGVHALRLAQQLDRILSLRSVAERRGTLHLFGSAPNAFTFFLGQLAGGFGTTQLYEYAFRQRGNFGDYKPSISFPPLRS